MRLRVQFGNNLHKWVFQKVFKLRGPVEQMQFETFWKSTPGANSFRIEREIQFWFGNGTHVFT